MILYFEIPIIQRFTHILLSVVFWLVMTLAGIFGFLIGIVTIAQISLTTPLTHNISGTAKACVQTLIAVLLGDRVSLRTMIGTGCVLFGSFMYSLVRSYEMDKKKLTAKTEEASSLNVDVEKQPLLSKPKLI